jgi:hypothetical protein
MGSLRNLSPVSHGGTFFIPAAAKAITASVHQEGSTEPNVLKTNLGRSSSRVAGEVPSRLRMGPPDPCSLPSSSSAAYSISKRDQPRMTEYLCPATMLRLPITTGILA